MRLYSILNALADNKTATYPVGAVYISAIAVNPGDLFGGTWEQIGKGRVLMGMGTLQANTTDKYGTVATGDVTGLAVGARGGTANTVLPEHTHAQAAHIHGISPHSHAMNPHSHTALDHSHTQQSVRSSGIGVATVAPAASGSKVALASSFQVGTDSTAPGTVHINDTTTTEATASGTIYGANPPIEAEGSDGTGKNLPPFEVVYFYKRVA